MSQQADGLVVAFIAAVIAVIIATLITAGIIDSYGRKPWNHPGSVPAGVTMLYDSQYIAPVSSRVPVTAVCAGKHSQTPDVRDLPVEHARFYGCARDQTWNDHRSGSISYAHALKRLSVSPIYWGSVLLFLTLALFYPAALWGSSTMRRRVERQARSYKVP